jgi:acyl-CoA synthetase (AMP-forming)/AMP-acid ligase II
MAQQQPDAAAVVVQLAIDRYEQYTFAQLNEESDRIAHGLEHIGITRGTRTVLMVTPSLAFFALTFALFKVGAAPVLVDPGMGIKNLKTCLAEAKPAAFIGIPKAHIARVILGWGKPTVKINVTVGRKLFWGGTTLQKIRSTDNTPYTPAPTRRDDTAAILFTSGSTGIPKGAVYTHGIFAAQIEILRQNYGIEPGEMDLATFPLFGLFGPALGMGAIVPDMDASKPAQADPRKIIAAINKYEATNMFGSPALIDVVGRYGEAKEIELTSLKRVISAGAPATIESLRRFCAMLPEGVQIFPSYGATEALPVSYIGTDEQLGETVEATEQGKGVCVGRPVADVKVFIIRITDEPIKSWTDDLELPPGEIGEIVVEGPVVTQEYFNRPESTTLAKIKVPRSWQLRHRMGDVGYFDDQGRLWMCGRKTHRVVTDTQTLFTIPCERIFNTHPAVRRTALVGINNRGKVEPVLCVELEKGVAAPTESTLVTQLKAIGAEHDITRSIKTFLIHPAFPVDIRHNAKIFREKLAVWAQEKQS